MTDAAGRPRRSAQRAIWDGRGSKRPARRDHARRGRDGEDSRHRYLYNNFPYAVSYPYLYDGYGAGGIGYYGSVADYAGATSEGDAADPGAPDFTTAPNAYYNYVAPGQGQPSADDAAASQPLPDAPAVGPQTPAPTGNPAASAPQQGPDSLVEAVQDELARRGYFAGKADAVYSPATREAIRRFQTDRNLPATGRINEATLHALQLD